MKFIPSPATFVVEEIAAYEPSGEGSHTFLWIEKQGLTTFDVVARLARLFGVPAHDVGYAGMKDRHATTRQWLSVPGLDPVAALALEVPDVRVLAARRHGNKLRTGHLRGNRFEAVITELAAGEAEAVTARLTVMFREGLPNRYGDQRFGAAGDNAAAGLLLLRGETRERDRRRRRLMLSAAQSAVFNLVLDRRAAGLGLRTVVAGDVLAKSDSGGTFVTTDPAADQTRVDGGEIVVTGPMPGSRAMEPPPGTDARALEDDALAALGATRADFLAAGRELPGTRRPLVVPVTPAEPAIALEGGGLRVRFALPSGAYATEVLRGLTAAVSSVC